MNDRNEMTEFDVDLITETNKAWLLEFDDGEEHWVPKSVGVYDEDADTVELPQWFINDREIG